MAACIGVMAGGTGGHVVPALAVAQALRERGAQVFWIGTHRGLESRLVPEHGFELEWVRIEGLRGKGITAVLAGPVRLLRALWQARAILRRRRPARVIAPIARLARPHGIQ